MARLSPPLALIALLMQAAPAAAYVGPGAGIGAIGTVIALFAALLLLVVGFVWYPMKRMLAKRRAQRDAAPKS